MTLVHHELCFGCGRVNLFGLLAELEPSAEHAVAGRSFIKQDHQGPDRRSAHRGIVATALIEAMALACGTDAHPHTIELTFISDAPVGAYLDLTAEAEPNGAGGLRAEAAASHNGDMIARSRGSYD